MDDSKEQAIPFLIYDQQTKIFTLTQQGEDVIRSINGNFGVISVAGMYRTGKSYLLNRMLLNREKGFSVGPTVNPCTKGLWIWSKPIYGVDEQGKRLPLLLIDTEGFGAFDEDTNHDVRIFTLAILLCSYFVYNSLGSIDENAIQSLSFVINLSKHIQLKANNKNESGSTRTILGAFEKKNSEVEFDHEELANLFPSFLWVLRDFALQLVDENGETITAKEYLEKVLDNTKSHQEQEQKNKIRKLIKTYFRDRDCFTMVRPMLKEKDLQNLDNSTPDKLRPEFLEQVLHIRKKILNRVKVKSFKNRPLTPDMYINLIKSLIHAMNSGSVPNIESTWTSMCKFESCKAFEHAQSEYDDFIREIFSSHGITDNETFKSYHDEAKEKCLAIFKSKALGEVAEEYLKMLKDKIKEKFNYYSKMNTDESKLNFQRILQKWFSVIEYKIQAGELKNLDEIENEFTNLEGKINENFSKFDFRIELFNDFKTKVLNFASDFFMNQMKNEVNIIKQENSQVIEKLNQNIIELKTNHEKEINKKNSALDLLKTENIELKESLNKLKENLALLEKEKSITEKNLKDKIERLKEDQERKITELFLKNNQQEDKVKEFERKAITVQAEAEKEKALYEQKIEQMSKQIEDLNKRDKESGLELKSQLKEQQIALRDSLQKYESTVKEFRREIENLKEKIIDLESSNSDKEHKLEFEKNKNEELDKKLKSEKTELTEKINSLKRTIEVEKDKQINDFKSKEQDFKTKENILKIKLEEMELKNKTLDETYKNHVNKLDREIAILKQNNEFLEIQVKEVMNKMDEQKRNHENVIATLESKTFSMVGQDEFQKKIEEIKEYFENDKKQNEENYVKSKNILMLQIDSLVEKLNESEFKSKFLIEELQKENSECKIRLEKASKELMSLRNEKLGLNDLITQLNEESQEKVKYLSEEYEKKLEEKESRHQKEVKELNKTSEESVCQLKVLFESEKLRFEEKSKEDKFKNDRKLKELINEHESKLREVENDLKEEIENLQDKKEEIEEEYRNFASSAENEINNLNAKLEVFDNSLKESREAYESLNKNLNSQIDSLNENFNKQRADLQGKIENLTNDNNTKEKEITSLTVKKEQLEKNLAEKDQSYIALKKEFEDERVDLMDKVENYKRKYQESYDEHMINKLEYSRTNALLNQQLEFLTKKNEENHNQIEENYKKYEERLLSLRAEVEKDMHEKFERLQKDKDECEAKLLQKKKEIKEIEQTFIKQSTLIEKEKAVLNEKLVSLEEKKKEMQEQYEKEIQILSSNLNLNQKDVIKEKQELVNQIDSLKQSVSKLEYELLEKNKLIEKNQIVSDGKYKIVETQRDSLQKENTESQKRFQSMLENIQKKANADKEKLETSLQNSISNIEQKYLSQIKDLKDTHQKLYSELIQSNKDLDRQVKSLNMQAEIKNKSYDNSNLLAQIEDANNEKARLRKELEDLKIEKDKKIIELIAITEKDKESFKLKSSEIDEKIKEFESRKKTVSLEFEIERAKWSIEKENLNTKVLDLTESIERLEKKNETLTRENEKLKTDKSNHKRSTSRVGGLNIGVNNPPTMTNILNNSISNNNYFSTTNKELTSKFDNPPKTTRTYGNLLNNPYATNKIESNRGLDSSTTNDGNSVNISRNFNEKSFEKYEPKIDSRLVVPNSGNKNSSLLLKKEENGSSDSLGNSSFLKDKNCKK